MSCGNKEAHLACYLILEKDGKLLLMRRFGTGWEDGSYTMISGHLEGNETPAEGAIREAREEAGIEVHAEGMKVVHILHRYANREYIDFFVTAVKWDGEPRVNEPNMCDDVQWFDKDKLPKETLPYIPIILEKISKNEFYSEYGRPQKQKTSAHPKVHQNVQQARLFCSDPL